MLRNVDPPNISENTNPINSNDNVVEYMEQWNICFDRPGSLPKELSEVENFE